MRCKEALAQAWLVLEGDTKIENTEERGDAVNVTPRSIYISGPMTGYQDHNHGAFNELAQQLRNYGHTVWNPAEAFQGNLGLQWEDYMSTCMRGLLDCDTICALPGWETSVGARLEVAVALACGIEVEEVEDIAEPDRRMLVANLLGMTEVRK